MSVESTAYQKWTCDRCQKAAYVPNQGAAYGWAQVTRVDENNVASSLVFCPDCFDKYKKLMADEDKRFNDFLTVKPDPVQAAALAAGTGVVNGGE